METSWRSCAIWRDKALQDTAQVTTATPGGGTQGANAQTCAQELLPPLWPIPAAPPGAHCAQSGSGSASTGTAQCVLLTPGPALSARGRSASAGTHPFPCVPRVPPALTQVGSTTYLIQQIGDSINVMVGLRDPDHPLSTQDWGRGPEGEPALCESTDPAAQHCPTRTAPGWSPKRTFCLLGGTLHSARQRQARIPRAVTASWETGDSYLAPNPACTLGLQEKCWVPFTDPTTSAQAQCQPHCRTHRRKGGDGEGQQQRQDRR